MKSEEVLKLIGELSKASIQCYKHTNGHCRSKNAADRELRAARKLSKVLTDDPVTEEELKITLGW